MKNKSLEKDEVILLEKEEVIFNNKKGKFYLTNKNIIVDNKFLFINKNTKINLKDIKKYKERTQIECKNNNLIIQTNKDKIEIIFINKKDANQVAKKIKELTGDSKMEGIKEKANKLAKGVKDVVEVAAVGIAVAKTAAKILPVKKK